MTPETAEVLALQALAHVAADDDLSGAFMGGSGLSPDDLRQGASDPVFLASVLDFLTQRDDWVMAFCDAHGLPYDAPLRARYALPGAEQVHWT
ncbi:DUF3572 domain-containing protein [Loktanella sp. M215]|uniref:DUF3572 domain-containing protein n=1 Tax=Loktanella sp. M215 TaxID=2675431 RepID=UPI001F32B602|nr:DUF3572 domain-containing protein [Loktanella sp. M215]MBU2360619.1 DUF3572 domain-containing protein [Alphaproteobacteria bacterium]MCF7701183.1 DUF3572 family protein [Loktanella sp. M215]